jgi:hypothetical protein
MDAKSYVFKWRDGTLCRVYWATLETYLPQQILSRTPEYIAEVLRSLAIVLWEGSDSSFRQSE